MLHHLIFWYFLFYFIVLNEVLAMAPYLRIIGGENTEIKEVPYQVAILNRQKQFCGGSLIGSKTVLTAAHCFSGFKGRITKYYVRAGSNYYDDGGVVREVVNASVHEKFNYKTLEYDVAILKVHEPFPLTNNIQIIPLGNKEPDIGDQITVSGWGKFNEDSFFADSLQSVKIPVVSRNVCKRIYIQLTKTMFCGGFVRGGRAPCLGDSGGPAASSGKLVGIVSWSVGCAIRNKPSVYTNIANLKFWIEWRLLDYQENNF